MKMPWQKSDLADPPKFASAAASAGTGFTGQIKSMGTAMTSAMGKAKTAVTSTFSTKSDINDATSLAAMPDNLTPELWVTNGQYNETIGNTAKALDSYTKALEKQPQNESALLSVARLYSKQEQHAQAAEFFQKAIAVNPVATSYNELALAYQNLGKPAEASVAVQKAIEIDPANRRYRNNLASLLVSAGRSDEAVQTLQSVFTPAEANYNVAYLNFSNNNMAGAQQHLQLALQADPNLAPAKDLMAKLGGGQSAQTAVATYNAANQLYRTAQAIASPTVQASQVPYQQPATTQPPATTASSTAYPAPPSSGFSGGFPGAGMPTTGN